MKNEFSNPAANAANASTGEAMVGKAAAQAHQAIDSAAGRVPPLVDKAAGSAHDAIDSAAGAVQPAAKWASDRVQTLVQSQEQLADDMRDRVKKSPLLAIAGAVGVGFLLGRLW